MTSADGPRAEQLSILVEHREDRTVVRVTGELDVYTADTLRDTLDGLAPGQSRVVVDLTGLGFMDSSGLGVLVGAKKQLPDGAFSVACGEGPVMRLLTITGLVHVLGVFDSVDDAVAAREAGAADRRES